MKVVIICGSSRADSQSIKVCRWLESALQPKHTETVVIDLHTTILPVYDDTESKAWAHVASDIQDTDAFILVTPEWNGSASPAMMNFLTYASVGSQKPLAHRPVLIVSVSSGAGGSYPIAQLKAFGNKNNFPVFIPDHIRIRNVESVLNSEDVDDSNEADVSIRTRSEYALNILLAYAEKLQEIRATGLIDLATYRHGN